MRNLARTCRRVFLPVMILLAVAASGCMPSDRAVIDQAKQFNTGIEPAIITDPQLAGYIQQVGDRIIDAARRTQQAQDPNSQWMFSKNMQFHLVNSKTLNAFTTGGEHMYVYNELFQQCQSEDELAAVMSHEFAHVYGRHVAKGMRRQYMTLGAAAAAGGAGYLYGGKEKGSEYAGLVAGGIMAAGQFIGMSYTRGDEAQADELGFQFYTRAGWDPDRFGDFFQHMVDMGYDKGPEMLSDHPSLTSRADLAKQRADELPPEAKRWRRAPVASASEFKRLQARARQVAKTVPDDRSLQQTQELLAAMPRSCLTPAIHEDQKKAEQAIAKKLEAAQAKKNPPQTK
ncbi:MAG: M48 family metalloprotease [Bacillota bacterium]